MVQWCVRVDVFHVKKSGREKQHEEETLAISKLYVPEKTGRKKNTSRVLERRQVIMAANIGCKWLRDP